ncbi:MAG: hypothetical protein RBR09_09085 [Desulfobulbaceae bacterium]|jgi:hypothetical protein|nr:hypothetical protein [Desulfobulbaceae bacterium]MDY0351394.1 hypothetical protein [Desulfobulbaceae bacterium]
MPNTFVHLGVQTPVSRILSRGADFKWIALGCIIPDVPWIVQRVFHTLDSDVDLLSLRSYTTVQASLLGCLILSGVFALAAADSRKLFALLACNSVLHLLLDALEIKWAGGVHFLAPLSWDMTGFRLFWPEHAVISALTVLGALTLVHAGPRDWKIPVVLSPDRIKRVFALLLLAVYFILPIPLASGPAGADNHFVTTLRDRENRAGKYLELDRSRYRSSDNTVAVFSGERLKVRGMTLPEDGVVSVRGNFIDQHTIHISAYHVHSPLRDISSVAALAGVMTVWVVALVKKRITFRQTA